MFFSFLSFLFHFFFISFYCLFYIYFDEQRYLNGLFAVGRSIGLVGHAIDQKRMKQPMYRHPWEDVLYDM